MVDLMYTQPVVAVCALLVIWSLETWQPFSHGRKRRVRHALRNLALGALNAAALGLIMGPVLYVVATYAEEAQIGLLRIFALPPLLTTILAILMLDGWMYLWHRASHRSPLLWRFHSTHHSDSEMDVTTATRFHTVEIIISATLRLALIPLLGLTLWQVLLYDALLLPIIQFHHSNINVPERLDRIIRLLIASPAMHRVHHSRIKSERDSNYSSIFSFWDRLAGTLQWHGPRTINYGLEGYDANRWQQLTGLLRTPFTDPVHRREKQEPAPLSALPGRK